MFLKVGVVKYFSNFTGKISNTCVESLFNKVNPWVMKLLIKSNFSRSFVPFKKVQVIFILKLQTQFFPVKKTIHHS